MALLAVVAVCVVLLVLAVPPPGRPRPRGAARGAPPAWFSAPPARPPARSATG